MGNEDGDDNCGTRFRRLKSAFQNPLTEVHVAFFTAALPLCTHYNLFLQRSDPLAHKVHPMTIELARKIGIRFLQPSVLKSLSKETLLDESLYLPLEDIDIGLTSKSKLKKLLMEGDITKQQYTRVLQACQAFYKTSLNCFGENGQ